MTISKSSFAKLKKDQLINIIDIQETELVELRDLRDWANDVENQSINEIEKTKEKAANIMKDIAYDAKFKMQCDEDPKEILEWLIARLNSEGNSL